jgi:GntR family transcriptional regulator
MAREGVYVELADQMAAFIETELRPGDPFLTLPELAERFDVHRNTASKAVQVLKDRGILSGKNGGRTWVRVRPRPTRRHNSRYQREKDNALLPEDVRRQFGVAESDSELSVWELYEDSYQYDVVKGPEDVRAILDITEDGQLLRRTYRRRHAAHAGASGSTSYLPLELAQRNPELLDSGREPWPGGTMHQLRTIGIELDHIDDHVVAAIPTREEQQLLDIPSGVPIIRLRKISWSTEGKAVEVADIPLPADRTELTYTTPLDRWL